LLLEDFKELEMVEEKAAPHKYTVEEKAAPCKYT